MDKIKLSKIFKALSNPHRLELYLKILEAHEASFEANRECLVTDMIKSMNIGAPTISHHIKELSNAELIRTEKRGKFLICKINKETYQRISEVFNF